MPNKSDFKIQETHDHSIILDSREIFLHGYYCDEDWGVDFRSANTFIKNMRLLDQYKASPIIIHQHSIGGEWHSGMAIYDTILTCKSPIILICYGIAASMGSVIPQAVYNKGLRINMPNCDWLIHEGYTSADGTHKQFYSTAQHSERLRKEMYRVYSKVCMGGSKFDGCTEAKVLNYIRKKLESKEDWWLSAEESVDYGFADAVFGTEGFESIEIIKNKL